jgi:penicillin-binding protein 1C
MWDVSGVSGAAPIWLNVMNYLNRDAPRHAPPRPTTIKIQDVEFERHVEPARSELFLAGTAVTRVVQRTGTHARAHIVYPGNGTIIAFDPDIPSSVQRVRVGIKGDDETVTLRLDGLPLAMRDGVALWQPTGRRHTLTLIGVRGNEEDRVEFEVRGGGLHM